MSERHHRRRRKRRIAAEPASEDTGLLDVLANLVGVLAMFAAITSLLSASGDIRIKTPMNKPSDRQLELFQVSKQGVWALQPAVAVMAKADRQRVAEVNRCAQLEPSEQPACDQQLESWRFNQRVGQSQVSVTHREGIIRKEGKADASVLELKRPDGWLDQQLERLQREKKGVFILLENDGFDVYRLIKRRAHERGVPVGWEPWFKGDPIYFWGNAGRNLSVQ